MVGVDWFRVITDLQRHGVYADSIAKQIGVAKSTVQNWKIIETEPRHRDGEALLRIWRTVTEQQEPPMRGTLIA